MNVQFNDNTNLLNMDDNYSKKITDRLMHEINYVCDRSI